MQVKSLVLGAVGGFVLGWITSGLSENDAARPAGAAAPGSHDPSPATLQGRRSSRASADQNTAESGDGVSRQDAPNRNAQEIKKPSRTLSRAVGATLVAQLVSSRSAGDWEVFNKALRALAKARTPAAQNALMDVLADLSIVFPKRVGWIFYEGLEGSSLEGIADAARKRFEQQIASGRTSRVAADGWVHLVADHGNEEAVAWLGARKESTEVRRLANMALARSLNPLAVRYARKRFQAPINRVDWTSEFVAFVETHPDKAFDMASEWVRLAIAMRPLPGLLGTASLMDAFVVAIPQGRLWEAKALLLRLTAERDRVLSVWAVQGLRNRNLNVEGLDALVRAPQVALEMMGEADGAVLYFPRPSLSDRAYLATTTIEANRITWSEGTARALEAAAIRLDGSSAHSHVEDMKKVAAMIRADIASPWRKR